MAKKFGKVLLVTAAVASAAAAVYYYMQKKDAVTPVEEDEDFDDFGEDLDTDATFNANYVPLTPGCAECTGGEAACASCEAGAGEDSTFTPLSEQVATVAGAAAEAVTETVEEFFDEDDTE